MTKSILFNIDEQLKLIGFFMSKHNRLEYHVNGYMMYFYDDKFYYQRKEVTPRGMYVQEIDFEDIKHKRLRKVVLLCKALDEVRKEEWGINGYEVNIIGMIVAMFLTNKRKASNIFTDASGNQTRVAERYIELIRKGEMW
jgi:hypothetical protein